MDVAEERLFSAFVTETYSLSKSSSIVAIPFRNLRERPKGVRYFSVQRDSPPLRAAQSVQVFRDVADISVGRVLMRLSSSRLARITLQNTMLALSAFLLCVASSHAQKNDANAVPISCANEIPVGVKVIRLPEADQHKVVISDFGVSASKDAPTY